MRSTTIKLCTVIIASTLILNTEQLRRLSGQSTLTAESTANSKGLANAGTRIANESYTQRAKEPSQQDEGGRKSWSLNLVSAIGMGLGMSGVSDDELKF